jgi:hypothetical protein
LLTQCGKSKRKPRRLIQSPQRKSRQGTRLP